MKRSERIMRQARHAGLRAALMAAFGWMIVSWLPTALLSEQVCILVPVMALVGGILVVSGWVHAAAAIRLVRISCEEARWELERAIRPRL
jgi:hypothetical protein